MIHSRKFAFAIIGFGVALILLFGLFAGAQETGDKNTGTESQPEDVLEPKLFVTKHKARFNGKMLSYTATAGETFVRDNKGEPKASIFTFAYTKTGLAAGEVRPVTFIWNGGPGSASTWLHMGTFGPKRVPVPSDARHAGAPPYPIIHTPETILDVSDLVFVDPVGTGFSRALGDHDGKEFWGVQKDARSMAEFIRTWTTENKRWNSPRFLLGESYGTTRAAAVANILESDYMMSVNGIIFISQALDYQGSSPYIPDNIISYITYVPTMAATAWYHKKINPRPESLEAFVEQSRVFAVDELLPALFKGNRLDDKTRAHIRDRLAYFTGLSPEYVERADLRVRGNRFTKELLRDQGLAVGNLDGRYTSDDVDDLTASPAGDASSDGISSAIKSGLMAYMRDDLDVDWNRTYFSPGDEEMNGNWEYQSATDEPIYVNTAHDLASAMRVNPSLKVMVASGYYDLTTPFFDAEFTLNRHGIKRDQISYKYYEGGHMMYVNEGARIQLLKDTHAFIKQQIRKK